MNARSTTRFLVTLSTATGLLVAASQAAAHARLVSANPSATATVATPRTITLHFNEKLVAKFSGLDVMKANGTKVGVAAGVPPTDPKAIVGVVSGNLAPGAYMVMWHAVAADDGHRTKGAYNFTVH
jgi:hypothetical protein